MLDFYDDQALLERLTHGVKDSTKPVVFLVGSALTAPPSPDVPGVPTVQGMIDIILDQFGPQQKDQLQKLTTKAQNPYQEAFHFLLGLRGPQATNGIIKAAVAKARKDITSTAYEMSANTSDDACRSFDLDKSGWHLSPAVQALGCLAVYYPLRFGRTILTTNFDPLIGAAISIAGGSSFRTILHGDGNISQSDGEGTHVVHIHGYWFGSDTLHTPRQLNQPRPQLKSSLSNIIRDRTIVVMAYGGWDDAFKEALRDVILDDSAFPEVIWTFKDQSPQLREDLILQLQPGISRGRVTLYSGIDCNKFLPALMSAWEGIEPRATIRNSKGSGEVKIASNMSENKVVKISPRWRENEEDRPPSIEFYVGRSNDFDALTDGDFRIAFITGMGGQGKTALAATYFSSEIATEKYPHRLWRDCREVSEKFEDQLAFIIEGLNAGRASGGELAKQSIEDLADIFGNLTEDLALLIVFDNVDHYVDLQNGELIGAPGRFVSRFLNGSSKARIIFTCRPKIFHSSHNVISRRLEGLTLADTHKLFSLRSVKVDESQIEKAHTLTQGHAFWLDLLAAQVAKNRLQAERLDELLNLMISGEGEIPDATLRSIWEDLPDREKIVLQALAETLRPTSDLQLADYIGSRLRFNQMSKAIRGLRDLNLIVIKPQEAGVEGLELHPLIRAFIRQTFPRTERNSFIDAILTVYYAYIGAHRTELQKSPTSRTLMQWIEGSELCINAGNFERSLEILSEVCDLYRTLEPPGEYLRVCERLFSSISISECKKFRHFEDVFDAYVRIQSILGRTDAASNALDLYRETLEGKDARYIHFCDMQAHLHWANGNYPAAIKWGSDGATLKANSGVDTKFSSDHTLALAQRDSGAIDPALTFFLQGNTIENVLAPDLDDKDRGGAYYGNIGRCLHLMGQTDPALSCYKKSARLIDISRGHIENEAFIRQWMGELFLGKGELETGKYFILAASAKWSWISPPRASQLLERLKTRLGIEYIPENPNMAELYYQEWIHSM